MSFKRVSDWAKSARCEGGCGGQVLRLRLLTAGRPAALRLDLRPARALRRAEAALAAGAHRRACRSRDGHSSALLRVRVRVSGGVSQARAPLHA
jgi:hypothetical protein